MKESLKRLSVILIDQSRAVYHCPGRINVDATWGGYKGLYYECLEKENAIGFIFRIFPVVAHTNCDIVELFLNGKSYGVKYLEFPRKGNTERWNKPEEGKVHTTTGDLHLSWDVIYEPGELVARGKKDGKEYTHRVVTSGEPAQIRLTTDQSKIKADRSDVAHITVEILDKDGNLVPTADNLVEFKVDGARLIGVESGNMRDLSSPKDTKRKAFNGLCMAIIQAKDAGKIKVEAVSEGLSGGSIEINASE